MPIVVWSLLAAMVGIDSAEGPVPPREAAPAKASASKDRPQIAFEIRDISVYHPDWRAKLLFRSPSVSRQEGTAVWSLDGTAFGEFLNDCQADARSNVLQAPKMTGFVGDPARMTSEEAVQYVASFKRVADGAPNQSTRLAFEPQVDKVHSGVRVNILSSQLRGKDLLARVVIEEHRLVTMHTVKYTETVLPKPGTDLEVSRASFLDRLNPNHAPRPAAISATLQVPEVDSRRVEGEWVLPSEGALLVSLGPRPEHERGLLKGYAEHLIAISARPITDPAPPAPAQAAAPATPNPR
jgi:hypothetical protein